MVEVNHRIRRAEIHRALGDELRLQVCDLLAESDRTPGELAAATGMSTNLLAFHLRVLEEAGVVERRVSEGDARRRYVTLRLPIRFAEPSTPVLPPERVLFVCTHNSARSQFAEAMWQARVGSDCWSAGTEPAKRVDPTAVDVAAQFGLDLSGRRPKSLEEVSFDFDLTVSVCDRVRESGRLSGSVHWSVPDPVGRDAGAYLGAFQDIADRIERAAAQDGI